MMSKERLHPVAIFFTLIKMTRQLLLPLGAGFLTFKSQNLYYFILATVVVYLLLIIYSALRWYRFTYVVEEEELRIEYGLFIRKQRYIPKNRIQSIDLTASVLHRIFKLVKVQIETAGSGDGAEASLSAVTYIKGQALRKKLKSAQTKPIDDAEEILVETKPSEAISFKRLFIAGSTSGSIGFLLALAGFGFSESMRFIPEEFYKSSLVWASSLNIILIMSAGLIFLVLLWLLSIIGTMIKYGNFKIIKSNEELFITRGLLEKRELTIPLRRIQAVGTQESIFRQPFGYVTVYVEIAGGSMDNSESYSVLFPIMKATEVEGFLQKFLPDFADVNGELNKLPKRAKKFYLFRSVLPVLFIALGIGYFLPQFSWILIILLAISSLLGSLRHRDGGYYIEDDRLKVRYRSILNRQTMIIFHKRVQAIEKQQHIIQKREKTATIKLSITGALGTGTHYTLKDLDVLDAERLVDWYSYRSL